MRKRMIFLTVLILILASMLAAAVTPVGADDDLEYGDGDWCMGRGDGVWFCFWDGPTIPQLIHTIIYDQSA